MNDKALAQAGTEKLSFYKRPVVNYPAGEIADWYGYKRHNFELEGCKAFIVEPPNPAPGLPWTWCTQWAEAFVPRTPALKLLERGFHHVHIDVFPTRMNPNGIRVVEKFYAFLQSLGFHKKGALIGMSYGGLFAFRWAAEHPETVGAIYADAPVCSLSFFADKLKRVEILHFPAEELRQLENDEKYNEAAYGVDSAEELEKHPLSPVNNYLPIAKARIPILAIRSGQDQTVLPESNIDILEKRLREAGGDITVIRRDYYGHHPHGLDDPQPLADFILQHYPEF